MSDSGPVAEAGAGIDLGKDGDSASAIAAPGIPAGDDSSRPSDSSATALLDSASTRDTTRAPAIPPKADEAPALPQAADTDPVVPPVADVIPSIPPKAEDAPAVPALPPKAEDAPAVPVLPPKADDAPAVPPVVAEAPATPPVAPEVPVLPPKVEDVPSIPPVVNDVPAVSLPSASSRNAALAARMGVPVASIFMNTDLEGEDPSCWSNRVSGFNRAGCGQFKSIGSYPLALSTGGIAHSGSKAFRITYAANEEAGGSNVGVYSDTVNVRAYYYFDQGFDFGQGMKIGRVQSFNSQTQMNDVDVILQCRSVGAANQCGVTDMYQLGLHYNGRPLGSDWGAVSANVSFQRGRWYAVEYQVILNTPGMSDGIGRMWVDGVLVGERKNLRIRGSFGTGVKLNTVRVGGWYSNGAGGNSCANPSQPSRIYMDDVAIAKGYIGPEPSGI